MYEHTLGKTAAWLAGLVIAGGTTVAVAGPDDDGNRSNLPTAQSMGAMQQRTQCGCMQGEGMQGGGTQGEGMQGEGMQGEGMQGEGMQGEGMQGMGDQGMQSQGTRGQGMQSQGMQDARQPTQIAGRVIALKRVQVRGTQQANLVALVETRGGGHQVVDLGPCPQARRLALQIGDRLTARGYVAQLRGRSVLIAMRARAGNETLSIDRSMQRRQLAQRMRSRNKQASRTCPRSSQQQL